MKTTNLVFLIRDGSVCLARKQRTFAVGTWNGYGGKIEDGESVRDALVRELFEESGGVAIDPVAPEQVATIIFHNGPVAIFECHIFLAREWCGEPRATPEMGEPRWFPFGEIPYDEMLPGDRLWVPKVFSGEKGRGLVRYNSDFSRVEEFTWTETDKF